MSHPESCRPPYKLSCYIENWLRELSKLQRVQNAAARLVVRCHRCEHITTVLMKLHWLSVKQRVQYSILLLVFRAQHRLAPPYITDLLEQKATRVLRSTTNNDFYVPPSRSRYGDRMFSVASPRLWNSLPVASWLLKDYWKPTYSGLCMEYRHLSVYLIFIFIVPIYYLVHVLH